MIRPIVYTEDLTVSCLTMRLGLIDASADGSDRQQESVDGILLTRTKAQAFNY